MFVWFAFGVGFGRCGGFVSFGFWVAFGVGSGRCAAAHTKKAGAKKWGRKIGAANPPIPFISPVFNYRRGRCHRRKGSRFRHTESTYAIPKADPGRV